MAGPGRPRGTQGGGKPLGFRPGREKKSIEEMFKVSPDPKILIGKIEDDYRKIKRDPTRKVSELTLRYLKDMRIVKYAHYSMYKQAAECPENRHSIPERNVIEHINNKLIELYESI